MLLSLIYGSEFIFMKQTVIKIIVIPGSMGDWSLNNKVPKTNTKLADETEALAAQKSHKWEMS